MAVVSTKFLPPFPIKEVFFCLEKSMLQFIFCLFGLHGVTEISDNKKECRDCLKEVKWLTIRLNKQENAMRLNKLFARILYIKRTIRLPHWHVPA